MLRSAELLRIRFVLPGNWESSQVCGLPIDDAKQIGARFDMFESVVQFVVYGKCFISFHNIFPGAALIFSLALNFSD